MWALGYCLTSPSHRPSWHVLSRLVWHQWTGPCAAVLKEKHPGPNRRSQAEPQEMNSLAYGSGYVVLTGFCQAKKILVQAEKTGVAAMLR